MNRDHPVETHDPLRQRDLRERAQTLAVEHSANPEVLAVLLSGSAARGPVNQASDLDLHVICSSGEAASSIAPWSFGSQGIVENVHAVPLEKVEEGMRLSTSDVAAFATWLQSTAIGDELQGSQVLFLRQGHEWLIEDVDSILTRRRDGRVASALSIEHTRCAATHVSTAHADLEKDCPQDAHQALRYASQSLLQASLIRQGWIVRGSKKRIELAAAYSADPVVSAVLTTIEEVVGLAAIDTVVAREMCQARLAFRETFAAGLREMAGLYRSDAAAEGRIKQLLAFQTAHSASAADYYEPLLADGFYQGPVNHIRALSGFSRVPTAIATCLDLDGPPVRGFLELQMTEPLRTKWQDIAILSSDRPRIAGWIGRCDELCAALGFSASPA